MKFLPQDKRAELANSPAVTWLQAWKLLRQSGVLGWPSVMAIGALLSVSSVTEAFGLALVYPLIEFIQYGRDAVNQSSQGRLWQYLIQAHDWIGLPISYGSLAAGIVALVFARQATSFCSSYLTSQVKEGFTRYLRKRLAAAILNAEGVYLNLQSSGSTLAYFGQLSQQAGNIVSSFSTAIVLTLSGAIYLSALFFIAPVLTIFMLLGGAFSAVAFGWFVKRAKALSVSTVAEIEAFSSEASERVRLWRLIKLSGRRADEIKRLDQSAGRIGSLYLQHVIATGWVQLLMAPLILTGVIAAIYVASFGFGMTVGALMIFVAATIRLAPLVESSTRLRQTFSVSSAALARLHELISQAERAAEPDPGTRRFIELKNNLRFSKVDVVYPDGTKALDGIDFTLPARRIVAIIGPSGAGKTTLIDCLTRLVQVNAGNIYLDDQQITDFTLESLRGRIAVVTQNPLLFDSTVRENLLYARPDATDEEIEQALVQANAIGFVRSLPGQLNGQVGENGANLSGGQRQRLALARAFLSKASVIVLDEPTSALDWEAERFVVEAMASLRNRGNVTLIVIAHRASTVEGADLVISIRDGKVCEQGTPSELAAQNGYFKGMIAASVSALPGG